MHLKKIIQKAFNVEGLVPNKKLKVYRCHYCGKNYAYHVTRMAQHLKFSCVNCPTSIKNILKSKSSGGSRKKSKRRRTSISSSDSEPTTDAFPESDVDVDSITTTMNTNGDDIQNTSDGHAPSAPVSQIKVITQQEKNVKRSNMTRFCDKMSKHEEQRLHQLFATAIYALGTPLRITDSVFWQDFFKVLRPSYNFPSRYEISNSLLDESYNKVKGEVDEKVQSANFVGLQCDGWSNLRNEGIINFIVTTPEPVFFKTITTTTNSQTAEYIAKQISEVIDAIGPTKLLGVCTDNAASMKCAWRILQDQYHEDKITFYGCSAHILNLLIKDAMSLPSIDKVSKNATMIVKEIKDKHLLTVKILTLLKPIGKWITTLEGDNPKLSLVPEAFHELKTHFVNELEKSDLRILSLSETVQLSTSYDKRRSMAINRIHFAANILDPSLKGRNLNDEDSVNGTALIFELANKFKCNEDKLFEELTEFTTNTGIWSHDHVRRAVSVTSVQKWWKAMCGTTNLSKIAVAILNLPATSAATERSFSTFGWIHSSKRNRLSNKRAGMITYIAHNLKLLRPKNEKKIDNEREENVSDIDDESSYSGTNLELREEEEEEDAVC
ncbi:uncharacterized protein [Venturia canescens]|uniref:uncharacterized protein n=1 Tax=Venturia canescens TaxID=32260 RepID=UPI001C9D3E37|nr:uncharacterized protein LOC122408457 [Venturia canescens]